MDKSVQSLVDADCEFAEALLLTKLPTVAHVGRSVELGHHAHTANLNNNRKKVADKKEKEFIEKI